MRDIMKHDSSHSTLTSDLHTCRSIFEVGLRLRDNRQTALRISLPSNFPQVRLMIHPAS